MTKLNLDRDRIDQCRELAEQIVGPVLTQVHRHSTTSIERCVLRLLGVEGALEEKKSKDVSQGSFPLVNELMEKLGKEGLNCGAGYWFGLGLAHHPRLTPVALARKIVSGEIDPFKLGSLPISQIDQACRPHLIKVLSKIRAIKQKRIKKPSWGSFNQPLKYIIVATGNIHEDIRQAESAAEMGADIIAVIRSTAQSLLDYVPEGETTEGFGGTYATQANFRLMREALDEVEKKLKRRIGLTNYSSGLCMAEIAVLGALEGVDYLLNDAMYGILFRDINMKRNFIDQHFSRQICALSGVIIQTGEDNYLTTAESHKYWYQVLTSHFINSEFARQAGISEQGIALGHAHEIDPAVEDSLLYEWAQAQLVREVFPKSPIKYMPPTKHKSGDIFFSYLYDGIFNLAGTLTSQSIQLLGMHTEAIHNPFVQDRFLSLKNANYVFRAAKSIRDEISFQPNGKIVRRARQVLEDAWELLKKVKMRGLLRSIEEGAFANVRRHQSEGKGLDGVFEKGRDYFNPVEQIFRSRSLDIGEEPERTKKREEDYRFASRTPKKRAPRKPPMKKPEGFRKERRRPLPTSQAGENPAETPPPQEMIQEEVKVEEVILLPPPQSENSGNKEGND